MIGLTKVMTKLYKSYLFTLVLKEMKRLSDVDYKKHARRARRSMKNIDFDKRYWLHKVGLTPYTPVKTGIGSGLFLLSGLAIGAVGAMVLAPMRGEDLRQTLKEKAGDFMHKKDLGETQAPARA
jgi:hypothetical protein